MTLLNPAQYGEQMGGKRRGVPVKTLKKILKKAGLKTTGKKAALTRRAKQAKFFKMGGEVPAGTDVIEHSVTGPTGTMGATGTQGGRKRRGKKYFF